GPRRAQPAHGLRLLLASIVIRDEHHQGWDQGGPREPGQALGREHHFRGRAEYHRHHGQQEEAHRRLEEDLRPEALAELGAQHDDPGAAERVQDDRRPHGRRGRVEALDHPAHGHRDGGDVKGHQHLAHGDDDHWHPRVARLGGGRGRSGSALRGHGVSSLWTKRVSSSSQTSGWETNRSIPNRWDRNLATSCPLTLLPALSSSGENVPSPPLPGETVPSPPRIRLLPGSPRSSSQSPEVSYSPAVAIPASA